MSTNKDLKCAPSKKYQDGSCFTLETLQEIAKKYNQKYSSDKINKKVFNKKEELVENLKERLADVCNEQTCWLRLDIVKEIEKENEQKYDDIVNNTFRPVGPSKKYDWLSTTHINNVIDQYHSLYPEFNFLGTVPYDFEELPILGIGSLNFNELKKNGKTKIGMVINMDEHNQRGSHWVALYADLKDYGIYYFDSVGKRPRARIRTFINRLAKYMYKDKFNEELNINNILNEIRKVEHFGTKKLKDYFKKNTSIYKFINADFDVRYNTIQHQFKNSECGVYSINFIISMLEHGDFDKVVNNITDDDSMNANRKIFFRNVN
jgi:hypothetical protein